MSNNASQTDVCKTCGRTRRRESAAGSLTQWLFNPDACDCDFVKLAREYDGAGASDVDELCFTCGKRVAHGRKGSLTQWVFRADTCSCARATLVGENGESQSNNPTLSEELTQAPAYPPSYEEPSEALTATLGLPSERYGAIKILGRGSLTKVYKCWDKSLNKPVAVKHLSGINLTSAEIIQFQDEAKATSTLSHPDIVRVLDFGLSEGGHPYMVMEFIEGESLDVLLSKHGPMPARIVALLTSSICAGMQHAHNQRIFHRDIKSSNIMIPLVGTGVIVAKIIDFGIAAIHKTEKEELVFQGHLIAGTPGYMSPDQLRGEPFDERSDIYSLGCTMFEALTGRTPFIGETSVETLSQHATKKPPSLRDANPKIEYPETIENIVAKTLSKNKADRFQSMTELKHALEAFLEESQVAPAAPSSEQEKVVVHQPAARGRNTILYAGLALTAIAGGYFVCMPLIFPDETKQAETAPIAVSTAEPESMSDFTRGTFHLASTSINDDTLKNWPKNKLEADLVASDVTDKGLEYIKDVPLTMLRVDACKISPRGMELIGNMKTLHILYIGDNPALTTDSIKKLVGLNRLEQLSMNATQLEDDCLKYVGQLKNLNYLSLGSSRQINGSGLIYLKNLPKLISIKVSGVKLSSEGLKALSELQQLTRLEARKVNFSEEYLDAICKLKNLEMLNLSETNLDDAGLEKLANLKHLRVLRIEICPHITGRGLAKFQALRPKCSISDGRTF